MTNNFSILVSAFVAIYFIFSIAGCDNSRKEKQAVRQVMETLEKDMAKGDFDKLDLDSIDISDTPADFQNVYLDLKSRLVDFKNRPKYVSPKGEKFDVVKFMKWLNQYMNPVKDSYQLLELRAAAYVPEIKDTIKARTQLRREVNEWIKSESKSKK